MKGILAAAGTALAALLAAGLSGCTDSSPAPGPSRTTASATTGSPTSGPSGSSGPRASSTPAGLSAAALAREVIAAGTASPGSASSPSASSGSTSSPPAPSPSAELGSVVVGQPAEPLPLRVAVTRLDAESHQTVLQLSARMVRPGTTAVPRMFSPEGTYRGDLSPTRSLAWLSLVDRRSRTRLFPYQYRWQPVRLPQPACVCMNEPLVRSTPQTWTVVLPPLPAGTTSVDVTIPRGFSDSRGLVSTPVATIRNVRVTHR